MRGWGRETDNEPTRQTTGYHTQRPGPTGVEGAGGTGCGARGRWRGLTGQRADAPSHTPAHQAPQVRRAPEGPEVQAAVGGGGAWLRCPWAVAGPGRASSRGVETTDGTPGSTGVEGAGGTGGPGCGARGRRWGLAGLRGDAPSAARGADGSRAGRRPRAHRAARPKSHMRNMRAS